MLADPSVGRRRLSGRRPAVDKHPFSLWTAGLADRWPQPQIFFRMRADS